MNQENNETGVVSEKANYKIEAKYSKEAEAQKLMRFTMKGNHKSFEISADDLIQILVHQVNMETLAPTFVDSTRVNVVQVSRQVAVRADRNIKKGEEIRLNYTHPYPLEFAILEEAMKIAKIDLAYGRMELTKEFIDDVKAKIQPKMEEFVKKFYESHKHINKNGASPQ